MSPRKQIEIENRRKLVASNILSGATYREAAKALNVSVGTVASDFKAIMREWRQHYAETINTYLDVQLRRYDLLLNSVWTEARGGANPNTASVQHLAYLDRALAIMDRQNDLLQLTKGPRNVDTKHEVNITVVPARTLPAGLLPE